MKERKRWILHLDIDAFFASAEVLFNPSLKGKPIIVGGLPNERGAVATASYEARKFGVYSGMPLKTAYQLCPDCIFIRGDYSKYAKLSEIFFNTLSKFTSDLEMASLDEAYLDLTNCSLLYPSMERISKSIKEEVEKRTGLSISGGLGSSKFIAKLATEKAKPGGFFYVEHGKEMEFLKNINIENIPGLGSKSSRVLKIIGVEKIGDLWRFSIEEMKKLFGSLGEHIYFLSRGVDSSAVIPSRNPKSISRETTFAKDIWETELILAHLAYLSDRVAEALRKSNLTAHVIEIKVRFSDFSTYTKRESLLIPTNDMFEIYKLSKKLFLKNFSYHKLAIRLVGVKVSELSWGKTIPIFGGNERRRKERLLKAIDMIREKHGFWKLLIGEEKLLEEIYERNEERGFTLKTSSLTK